MHKFFYKNVPLEELIVRTQKNDYKALEELVRREQRSVYATFSYLCSDFEMVSDLTQEALLRMAKSIKNLKNPKTFKSWLHQIVSNLFYDELRKKKRHPLTVSIESEHDFENPYMQIPDLKVKPMEKAMSQEIDSIVKDRIQSLPENFKIAIVLRVFLGLSYDEIAQATNTSVGTVKSRIARAREKLQKDLVTYI